MLLVIVADDLTGAADSALPFRRAGFSVAVTTSCAALGALAATADVVGVDLRTRHSPPGLAYLDTFGAVRRVRATGATVFKKVDSQLRGNPADEVDGALDAWPEAVAICTPALPAFGRVVRDGHVHGIAPGGPRSVFDRLVGGTERAHTRLCLGALRDGRAATLLCALPAGAIALADAEDESDLAALVKAGTETGRPVMWVGSAGLAAHVAATLARADGGVSAGPPGPAPLSAAPPAVGPPTVGPPGPGPPGAAPPVVGPQEHGPRVAGPVRDPEPVAPAPGVLVLVASREPISRTQVSCLASCGAMVTEVPPDGPLTGWLGTDWPVLSAHLEAGGTVVVCAPASTPAGPLASTPADTPAGKETSDHARLVVSAAETLRIAVPGAGLVATGGETARALFDALGEQTGWVVGEVETGIPMLRTDRQGLGLVTKAGSFGTERSLVRAVAALQARPPAAQARPPAPQARPPAPQARPPAPQARPPAPQARPSALEARQ